MNWKRKAKIQNLIAALPNALSYGAYYWVQRHFGGLKQSNPISALEFGIDVWKRIKTQGFDPADKVFFEVGTGRTVDTPLAFWLMGADKTITVDLNPYLKEELVKESLCYISDHKDEIMALFGDCLCLNRWQSLIDLSQNPYNLRDVLQLCRIEYIAQGDATDTRLPPGTIDFHTSINVFEHIPEHTIKAILDEGNRILKNDGLFIHRIDYSDHFSHSDDSISSINFLQFNEREWDGYAGNKYMYMNRLREDDFVQLFQKSGHDILSIESDKDFDALKLVKTGQLQLDSRFQGKSDEVISTIASWVLTKKHANTTPAES